MRGFQFGTFKAERMTMDAAERRQRALAALGVEPGAEQPKRRKARRPRKVSTIIMQNTDVVTRKKAYFSCEKKARYKSEGEAHKAANFAYSRRGVRLRAYYCNNCGGWHLTKQMRGMA